MARLATIEQGRPVADMRIFSKGGSADVGVADALPGSGIKSGRVMPYRNKPRHISYDTSRPYSDYEQPKYGTDISSRRMDELDLRTLKYGLGLGRRKRKFANFVDLGAGLAIQSVRMALNGYQAFAYDLIAAPQTLASIARSYQVGRVTYITGDLSKLSVSAFPRSIDIIYSQRFIHYLTFEDAVSLLARLATRMKKGGHLFLSAAGFDTEIAQQHPDRSKPIAERFSVIDSEAARSHSITAALCIYRVQELELLADLAGYATVDSWITEFGNVQGVFSKR